jgi:hypothetical protein
MRSPNGRSTLTDLKPVRPSAANEADVVSAIVSSETRQSDFMLMAEFSRRDQVYGFNDIAHET